jgi:hypothetical protein
VDLAESAALIGWYSFITAVINMFAGEFLIDLAYKLFQLNMPSAMGDILEIILKNDFPTNIISVVASVFLVCGSIMVSKTSLKWINENQSYNFITGIWLDVGMLVGALNDFEH